MPLEKYINFFFSFNFYTHHVEYLLLICKQKLKNVDVNQKNYLTILLYFITIITNVYAI